MARFMFKPTCSILETENEFVIAQMRENAEKYEELGETKEEQTEKKKRASKAKAE